tara:strand:+ start:2556 stop:3404 length:849 start_codon:yes stop_codon:yes gene_type:complete
MTNDLATLENINLDNLDESALMALTGQGGAPATGSGNGLPRLSINYTDEDDDGNRLPKGHWKLMLDGRFVFAEKLTLRPFSRMYTYSHWDNEENVFVSQSIQTGSLGDKFPDTAGGEKCGRLTKDQEKDLEATDPRLLLSREVVCNQVVYATVSGTAKDAEGNDVELDNQPVVAYFKKSGFRPVREALDLITRQKKLMQKTVFQLGTKKMKSGSVNFWVPTFAQTDYLKDLTQDDLDLIKKFLETIKGYNDGVLEKFREAQKLSMDSLDVSLEAELDDADAA